MVQYYTLEQAAQILRVTPEKLREMAKRNEIRAFQDRGSLRFRAQEVDELARAKGLGSDLDLPAAEGRPGPASPRPGPASPRPGPASPRPTQVQGGKKPSKLPDDDSDEVPIGDDPGMDKGSSRSSSRIGKSGPRSQMGKSPPPKPASDSDVRLVMEGSDLDFEIRVDDQPKAAGPATPPSRSGPKSGPRSGGPKSGPKPSGPKSGPKSGGPKSPPSKSRPVQPDSNIPRSAQRPPTDSGVGLVEEDADAIALGETGAKTPSDSDIRVTPDDRSSSKSGKKLEHVTEEIDLDAEAAAAAKSAPASRPRPSSSPKLPTSSPFELSENDLGAASTVPPSGPPAKEETDSSDFELSLDEDSSEEFTLASDELPILSDVPSSGPTTTRGAKGPGKEGPVDSGISLEQEGSDEIEFELSLDPSSSSSAKKKSKESSDDSSSSSDFELSLDEDLPAAKDSSDSEFELNLDVEGSDDLVLEAPQSDSESEFELTLDAADSLDVDESSESSEAEVFETEFEVPALEEDSGSDAVALEEGDTDMESSDFELDLEEEPVDDSASDAVALEESEEDIDDVGAEAAEEEPEEEEEEEPVRAPAPPAPWGVIPAVFLMPSVIVLFLVSIMSFELMQGMWGYHKPGKVSTLLIDPIARMLLGDDKLPKN
jgi:excisionase family DNA binding protein